MSKLKVELGPSCSRTLYALVEPHHSGFTLAHYLENNSQQRCWTASIQMADGRMQVCVGLQEA